MGEFIARNPDAIHPITKAIIAQGWGKSAVDAFNGFYRLGKLTRIALKAFAEIDVLMVPTMPAACTLAQLEADRIGLNARLGTYTDFVNLLDLAGIAVSATLTAENGPTGVTFLAPSGGRRNSPAWVRPCMRGRRFLSARSASGSRHCRIRHPLRTPMRSPSPWSSRISWARR